LGCPTDGKRSRFICRLENFKQSLPDSWQTILNNRVDRLTAKLKTATLGCKVNQYETQYLREGLGQLGFQELNSAEPADMCIVNTCTVTAEGDAKSRQLIRRMHRDNPQARIIVMGCYATRAPEEIWQLPGVSEVITDKRELPDVLSRFGVVDIPHGISGLSGRHRAYIKVQDGCLLKCSYCVIPVVRPQFHSRPQTEIIDEVKRLVDRGFKEVVLTGIHLGHYGVDFNRGKPKSNWIRLASLVTRLVDLNLDFRVRLSSIECTEVTRELLDIMQDCPRQICPHLHVCLQSGSDRILRSMKRRWSVRRILDRCDLIKSMLPDPALTTDLIVGFPGESEREFEDSLRACRQIGFSKIHTFPFSARHGTPAAEMPHQIPKSVKAERGRQLAELETELKRDYANSLIGKTIQVLVEKREEQACFGTADRYLRVRIPVPLPSGSLVDVRVYQLDESADEQASLLGIPKT